MSFFPWQNFAGMFCGYKPCYVDKDFKLKNGY